MTLEVFIRSSIIADSTIFSAVGQKIFQNYVPQGVVYPAIVFFTVTELPKYCQGGMTSEEKTIQFSVLGTDKDQLALIKKRLNVVFDNKGGIPLDDSVVSIIEKAGLIDDEFEKETRVHHVAVSYRFKVSY
jgi:hypothetical protein